MGQLQLALEWNRIDMVTTDMLFDADIVKLKQLMNQAIKKNRTDFVRFFIENFDLLDNFFTEKEELDDFYKEV